jgi:hypothetical protein
MSFSTILKTVLPNLATALPLPPPFGAMAARMISGALGGTVVPTPDNLEQVLAEAQSKDPDIMVKLKQLDQEFQVQMAQLGINNAQHMEDLAAADRANARGRELGVKDKTPMRLAYAVVILTTLAEGYLLIWGLKGPVDPSYAVILGRVLGTLDAALMTVLTYYFGSSAGSADKTTTIQNMAQAAAK